MKKLGVIVVLWLALLLALLAGCSKETPAPVTSATDTIMYYQGWKAFHIKVECGYTSVLVEGDIDALSPKLHEFWKYDPAGNVFMLADSNTTHFRFTLPLNSHDCDSVVHILIRGCFAIHSVEYTLKY